MTDDGRLEFEYKPRLRAIVFLGLLSIVGAAGLGWIAATNDRGLILNRTLEFGTTGATRFYAALAVFFALLLGLAALMAYHRYVLDQRVILDDTGLRVAKSRYSAETLLVPYATIQELSLKMNQNQPYLHIVHAAGKHDLHASYLPSPASFDALRERLSQAFDAAHPRTPR